MKIFTITVFFALSCTKKDDGEAVEEANTPSQNEQVSSQQSSDNDSTETNAGSSSSEDNPTITPTEPTPVPDPLDDVSIATGADKAKISLSLSFGANAESAYSKVVVRRVDGSTAPAATCDDANDDLIPSATGITSFGSPFMADDDSLVDGAIYSYRVCVYDLDDALAFSTDVAENIQASYYRRDCKEVLDDGLSSGDGIYLLDFDGPANGSDEESAYCDMTTDGGGWTLIGRGREDWSWDDNGIQVAEVSNNVGTTSGFSPAYYAATVIDEILNGTDVSALTDGVRIKRTEKDATDGSVFQEVRWHFSSQSNWTWLFDSGGSGISLSKTIVDGTEYTSGSPGTRDYSPAGNNETRIFTWPWGNHNSLAGFCYGSSVSAGTNDPNNFLWEFSTENHSCPYTEVYLRR